MKKRLKYTLLFFIFAINGYSQKTNKILDSLVKITIKKYNIPSLTVAYIKKDTCFYGVKGNININSKIKTTLKDKYHLGSNTKAITSFIAFKLIENNKITLETKFIDLFPNLKKKIKRKYRKITLASLLSHNANVQPYTSGIEYEYVKNLTGNISEKRLGFAKQVLNQKPVKKGTYSNAGYVIVALMLEKCSNQTFEKLLSKYLAEMNINYITGFPNKENIESTWGHWMENKKLVALPPTHFYKLNDYVLSAGDVSMNIMDYSKFIQSNLQGLLGYDNYLTSMSYEKMHYGEKPYSYGWANQINKNGKLSFHDGSTGTYFCHTIISSTYEFAVVIFINSAEEDQIGGVMELRDEIFKIRKKIR